PNVDNADAEADTPGGIKTTIQSIDFGAVGLGIRTAKDLFAVNGGDGNIPLEITSIKIVETTMGGAQGLTVMSSPDPMSSPVLLPLLGSKSKTASTRSVRIEVSYTPSPGGSALAALLRIASNEPNKPNLDIPITGMPPGVGPPALRLTPM